MPKKTFILIIALFFITSFLLYLAIRQGKILQQPKPVVQSPIKQQVKKDSIIYFTPNILNLNNKNSATASSSDIFINSGINLVTGVQLEMTFDPKIISNASIKAPSDQTNFFGKAENYIILIKDIDLKNGRISFAIAITPNGIGRKGVGKVATITFSVNKRDALNPISTTSINFLNKTLVTGTGTYDSLLKQTTGLDLNLGISATPTPALP